MIINNFFSPLKQQLLNKDYLAYHDEIKQIHEKDRSTLEENEITLTQLVDKMRGLWNKHSTLHNWAWVTGNDIDHTTIIERKFIGNVRVSTQVEVCCFCLDKKTRSNSQLYLKKIGTHQEIFFSRTILHMIKHHSFFCGNVGKRLDPKFLIDFFELKKGENYYSKTYREKAWFWDCLSFNKTLDHVKEIAERVSKINDFSIAYLVKINGKRRCYIYSERSWKILNPPIKLFDYKLNSSPLILEGLQSYHLENRKKTQILSNTPV